MFEHIHFTDNEIISALEHCVSSSDEDACIGCPLNCNDGCGSIDNLLEYLSLDLIKRLYDPSYASNISFKDNSAKKHKICFFKKNDLKFY